MNYLKPYKTGAVIALLLCTDFFLKAQKISVDVSIIQNGQEIKIKGDSATIHLKKDKFKIEFNSYIYTENKQDATKIDAFATPGKTTLIHPGVHIEDIPYFSAGTGRSCDKDKEYECLYLDKDADAHHYISYMEGDRRAKLESKNGDVLRLSWVIDKYAEDTDKEISIKKYAYRDLYLVILNDFNGNEVVDPGEYSIIHIVFD